MTSLYDLQIKQLAEVLMASTFFNMGGFFSVIFTLFSLATQKVFFHFDEIPCVFFFFKSLSLGNISLMILMHNLS